MGSSQPVDPLGRGGEGDPVAGLAGPDGKPDGEDASIAVRPLGGDSRLERGCGLEQAVEAAGHVALEASFDLPGRPSFGGAPGDEDLIMRVKRDRLERLMRGGE